MAFCIHHARLLPDYCPDDCPHKRRCHIHYQSRDGAILAAGTGGLPVHEFGDHLILAEPYELDDFEIGPDGELIDHGAE